MFGYVRPLKEELKVREFEQFKAAYCGLCHTLRERYGVAARYILNYDFTFLAILLSAGEEKPQYRYRRCVVSPLKKKCCCVTSDGFLAAAGYSLILAYWRMRDQISDSGFIRSIPYRLGILLLKRGYKRAAEDFPEFDKTTRKELGELQALEAAENSKVDLTADKFACILRSAAFRLENVNERRILEQLLYHTGRWIYIIDAYDDLEDDWKTGNYNPLIWGFHLSDGILGNGDKATLNTTLSHSINLISSAVELLPEGTWSGILRNIIYGGIPWVTGLVLGGHWKKPRDNHLKIVDKRGNGRYE